MRAAHSRVASSHPIKALLLFLLFTSTQHRSSIRSAEMGFALRSVFLLCGLLAGVLAFPEVTYCPKGWTQLDDSCFMFVPQRRTFVDAEHVCILKGGNLASVLDAKEHALVVELIREQFDPILDTWIGLSDAIQEGTFLWTDGSPLDFTAYGTTQPDNFEGTEDCVEISDDNELWNDDGCTDMNYFVCMKEAHRH
ncbi:galactose-specific lectin nattectin [Syngnathus scovelli]|uniref:galactose-specific lectin nattectin n=1 Tax=Syngnathus scovelli TaxID=161590 RepID=UPI002110CD79|nr:galactose-specific lectin nattectin [Syngnathus scovelli]